MNTKLLVKEYTKMNELEKLQFRVDELEKLVDFLVFSDRYIFQKKIQMLDGRDIQLGTSVGTKIGTETTQKIAFFNATPVIQQSTISDPAGQANDLDSEARTAINSLIDRLQAFGFIA